MRTAMHTQMYIHTPIPLDSQAMEQLGQRSYFIGQGRHLVLCLSVSPSLLCPATELTAWDPVPTALTSIQCELQWHQCWGLVGTQIQGEGCPPELFPHSVLPQSCLSQSKEVVAVSFYGCR